MEKPIQINECDKAVFDSYMAAAIQGLLSTRTFISPHEVATKAVSVAKAALHQRNQITWIKE